METKNKNDKKEIQKLKLTGPSESRPAKTLI